MNRLFVVLSVLVVAQLFPAHAAFGKVVQYGAIARSESTGLFGSASYLSDRAIAEAAAVQDCRRAGGGTDCKAELWFNNACGAAAVSEDEKIWGKAWAARGENERKSRSAAEMSARQFCAKWGGVGCKVVVSVCSIPLRYD